ncbi:MAG TPA: hypothetical protein DF427_12750 [Moraxellaceae bacterium]|nr:hypothetical protein [Moraxellaceae bacterium]
MMFLSEGPPNKPVRHGRLWQGAISLHNYGYFPAFSARMDNQATLFLIYCPVVKRGLKAGRPGLVTLAQCQEEQAS